MPNRRLHHCVANFDITVRHIPDAAGPPYSLTASYGPRMAEGRCTQDARDPFWQQTLSLLDDPAGAPGQVALAAAGSRLFADVMQGAVRDLWINARADLDAAAIAGLRLRFALQPSAVACLPWELLYDPARNEALAANAHTPLVRVENLFQHIGVTRSLHTQPPIRILLAVPDDPTGQIDAAWETQQITDIVDRIGPARVQVASCRGRFDVLALRAAIEDAQPDVLHFVGHGAPDGLLLWQRGQPTWVSPTALRTIVQQTPSVKLVLLNACLSGRNSERQAFSTLGPQLLQAGVPAVIAMQFAIADGTASDFAGYVYTELLTGERSGHIDRAVSHARSNFYVLNPDSCEYATPVLWLNSEDAVIFEPDAAPVPSDAARAAVPAATADSAATAGEMNTLRTRVVAIEQWLTASEPFHIEKAAINADLRTLLDIRTREVRNLRSLFTQLRHLEENLAQPTAAADTLHLYRSKVSEIQRRHAILLNLDKQLHNQGAAE